ncbi:unnamed protein product [Prunus armeniaca]
MVPAEGSPILKLAKNGNFDRVIVKIFDVGLCASRCGGNTCHGDEGRMHVCLGASCFEAGYARLIMV